MSDRDGKRWRIERLDSALGYGAMFEGEVIPEDLTDALRAALTAWGELSDDAENAMVSCLPFANHPDPGVRELAITAIGKLAPKRTRLNDEALLAISRALSDSDTRVRESAESAVQRLRDQNGIVIDQNRNQTS